MLRIRRVGILVLALCFLSRYLHGWNITSTGRTLEEIGDIEKECNASFRIENGYLESLFISASFPDEMDPTPKCYIHCLLEKISVVSEDGIFDPDEGMNVFLGSEAHDESNQEVVTRCSIERKEMCKCERSYKFYSCLIESRIKEDSPCFLFDHSCMNEGAMPP